MNLKGEAEVGERNEAAMPEETRVLPTAVLEPQTV